MTKLMFMKKLILMILPAVFVLSSFSSDPIMEENTSETSILSEINWITLEEAEALNKENPKKIFIDFYTDWCGWCKKNGSSHFYQRSSDCVDE